MATEGAGDGGFTLLEVIAAFAMMALVLGAALAAISGGLNAQVRTGEVLAGLDLARSTLARVGRDLPFESGEVTIPETGDAVLIEVVPYAPAAVAWRALGTQPYLVRVIADGHAIETLRRGPLP